MMIAVLMISYNHESYIEQAVTSVMQQITDFPFRLIIGDDASTDGTKAKIEKLRSIYNDRITYVRNEVNLGMQNNFCNVYSLVHEKYVAICEGDDYWYDQNKLQKQIDFLERNANYSLCFHQVYSLNPKQELKLLNNEITERVYNIYDLARGNIIYSPSVVFRSKSLKVLPNWFGQVPLGDYALFMLCANDGLIQYFPDPMAVYRLHNASAWSGLKTELKFEGTITTINYLISHEFHPYVKKVLRDSKRSYIEQYLDFLMQQPDCKIFFQRLREFSSDDDHIGRHWLLRHFPEITDSIKKENPVHNKTLLGIARKKLGNLKRRLFK